MSRSTQYIGLNAEAIAFVSNLKKVDDPSNKTFGMFEEDVPLGTWEGPVPGLFYKEELQASPWSSGPMLFTAIRVIKDGVNGSLLYQWREDPFLSKGREFCFEHGTYWV